MCRKIQKKKKKKKTVNEHTQALVVVVMDFGMHHTWLGSGYFLIGLGSKWKPLLRLSRLAYPNYVNTPLFKCQYSKWIVYAHAPDRHPIALVMALIGHSLGIIAVTKVKFSARLSLKYCFSAYKHDDCTPITWHTQSTASVSDREQSTDTAFTHESHL